MSYSIRQIHSKPILWPQVSFFPYRKAVELVCARRGGAPGAGSSCGSPGEGTWVITWHVNQRCMATIRIHQIPVSTKQTGEVAIRGQLCVWSTYLVIAPGFLETPSWSSSDFPRVSRVVGTCAAVDVILIPQHMKRSYISISYSE